MARLGFDALFPRFVGSAVLCSVIDYLTFAVLYAVSSAVFASMFAARVVSVTCNFIVNRQKVFRSRGSVLRQGVGFALLAVFLFAASYGGVAILKQELGWNPLVTKVLVEVVLFLISYGVQRCLVFVRRTT